MYEESLDIIELLKEIKFRVVTIICVNQFQVFRGLLSCENIEFDNKNKVKDHDPLVKSFIKQHIETKLDITYE